MTVYNIDLLEPLQGKDVGLILGIAKTGATLSGTPDGKEVKFTTPTVPIYDKNCDGTVDKDDVVVYVEGTAVTVSSVDADKGEITLSAAPEIGKKITADYYEEKEPYIAQSLKVDAKFDEKTYGRLRSSLKKKQYGAKEVTISLDLLLADLEFLSLFFDESTGEMVSEPPIVYAYIPLMDGDDEIGRLYFKQCRMIPKSVIDVKEGDQAGFSLEISVDQDPILWKPPATP